MIGFCIRWVTNTIALIVVVKILPGIKVDRWETAALAALVLGFLNAFLRPIVILLTLPLHIISLGFFTLLVNAFMFYLVSKIVEGFYVVSFPSAFAGALLFSVISFLLNLFVDPQGKINVHFYQRRFFRPLPDEDIIDVEGKSEDDSKDNRKITF